MPVAGYYLTFTPVKSVSALWALSSPDVASAIEAAHTAAYTDVLAWLEDTVVCTRVGPDGIRQLPVTGLLAAAFTHRDSRTGDPNLHTHVAISNKVQVADTLQAGSHAGRWLALDGRPLHQLTVAASERYNTRLEAMLRDQLGLRFADRPTGPGKRPVREIVGVDPRLLARWSSRRADIVTAQKRLARRFQQEHGRPPTPVEALKLGKQATLATRPGKHGPRSQHSQRTSWRTEALEVLGGEWALQSMLTGVQTRPQPSARSRRQNRHRAAAAHVPAIDGRWVAAAADAVLGVVQAGRATWQQAHVRAEAERYARTAEVPAVLINETVDRIVTAALTPARSIRLGPPEQVDGAPAVLRRPDGSSVYEPVGSALYTSPAVLAAERSLLAVADRTDGRALSREAVDVVIVETAANGRPLNPGQAELVQQLACSGARLQLALAPAGTGKTTALGLLARAWTGHGGTVLALAPSAAAAAVLRADLASAGVSAPADTLAKLLTSLPEGLPGEPAVGVTSRSMSGATVDDHPYWPTLTERLSMHQPAGQQGGLPATAMPTWVEQVGPGTLVLIDEAGMAGTLDLARAVDYVVGRGGSVRLIGDDQQLAAVGAGGILRDLAHAHPAASLSDVVRLGDPVEGAASLALREGNPLALGFYLDHRRVHVGDATTSADQTYTAWTTDRAAGLDSLMLAPTRQLATELNQRARTDRLAPSAQHDGHQRVEPEVGLADGTAVSGGDLVLTRRNDRRLVLSATDWVKNGDRWQVQQVLPDGSLRVRHTRSHLQVLLPAGYVREHVTLGYASTIHTAQGSTADTCHTLLTGTENRQLLYVALTRGRSTNHVYLATSSDTETDQPVGFTPELVRPPSPVAQLERILAHDGAAVSATSTDRQFTDPAIQLAGVCGRYLDGLTVAAEDCVDNDILAGLDRTAERLLPGLTEQAGYPALRSQLALLSLHGEQADQLLHHAWAERDLTGALDPAAVLTARLPVPAGGGPLPWLPPVPAVLRTEPTWSGYLQRQEQRTLELCATVAEQTRGWASDPASNEIPAWARPLTEVSPKLLERLAIFRAAHNVDDHDLRPTGPPRPEQASSRLQQQLLGALSGEEPERSRRWHALAEQLAPRLSSDPHWTAVTRQLDQADAAGHVAPALLRDALRDPLPDEHPAAALLWRLHAGTLASAVPAPVSADTRRDPELVRNLVAEPAAVAASDKAAAIGWADLADRINPRLTGDPHWPALAAALNRAHAAGYDVSARLPQLVTADDPLPTDRPGQALHGRLIDECEAAVTPMPTATWLREARANAAAVQAPRPESPTRVRTGRHPDQANDRAVTPSEPSRPHVDPAAVGTPRGHGR